MTKLPTFFNYKEEGTDSGYETIQDFFLSWTLRSSMDVYQKDNFLINLYAKKILYSLLFGQNKDKDLFVDFSNFNSFKVLEVKTKRQVNRIDLIAEIEIIIADKVENYLLNIENKWYTTVKENQPPDYIEVVKEKFDLTKYNLVNVVVYCDETIYKNQPSQIELCLQHNYKFTSIAELADLADIYQNGLTGNYMFDEYWLRL